MLSDRGFLELLLDEAFKNQRSGEMLSLNLFLMAVGSISEI